jgi:hypothetical protein
LQNHEKLEKKGLPEPIVLNTSSKEDMSKIEPRRFAIQVSNFPKTVGEGTCTQEQVQEQVTCNSSLKEVFEPLNPNNHEKKLSRNTQLLEEEKVRNERAPEMIWINGCLVPLRRDKDGIIMGLIVPQHHSSQSVRALDVETSVDKPTGERKSDNIDNVTFLLLATCLLVVFMSQGTIFEKVKIKIGTILTLVTTLILQNAWRCGIKSPVNPSTLKVIFITLLTAIMLVASPSTSGLVEG